VSYEQTDIRPDGQTLGDGIYSASLEWCNKNVPFQLSLHVARGDVFYGCTFRSDVSSVV